MSDDLVKRLTIMASVMEMGEKIEWGSDTSIMREASARIEELEAKLAEAERSLDISCAIIDKLMEDKEDG